jgi:hypothetical protein
MDKATLDSLEEKGVEQVMLEMAKGMHGSAPDSRLRIEVQDWVSAKQYSATMDASKRRDKREEETLAIARSALSNSRRANFIAITAAILAAAATIIAAVIGVIYVAPK